MTRTAYADALSRLAHEQHQVVTTGQLAVIGEPANAVRNPCRPGGRWQRVLPRVIVLRPGALSAEQRCRAALAYAGHPQAGPGELWQPAGGALLTGAAALVRWPRRFTGKLAGSGAVHRKAEHRPRTGRTRVTAATRRGAVPGDASR